MPTNSVSYADIQEAKIGVQEALQMTNRKIEYLNMWGAPTPKELQKHVKQLEKAFELLNKLHNRRNWAHHEVNL